MADLPDATSTNKALNSTDFQKRIGFIFSPYRQNLSEIVGKRKNALLDIYQAPPDVRYDDATFPGETADLDEDENNASIFASFSSSLKFAGPLTTQLDQTDAAGTVSLLLRNYTSVIEAEIEQPWYALLLNSSLPSTDLFVIFGEREICRCYFNGNVLSATVPPLKAGSYFITFRCGLEPCRVQLVMQASDAAFTPSVTSLPISCIKPKVKRPPPRLCYTSTQNRICAGNARVPAGVFRKEELNELCRKHALTKGDGSTLLPRKHQLGPIFKSNGCFVRERGNLIRQSFPARLQRLQSDAKNLVPSSETWYTKEDRMDTRIPLCFKKMLRESCESKNIVAIHYFHNQLFEFLPFGMKSAHLFMKTHPKQSTYSIFAFTLSARNNSSGDLLKLETIKDGSESKKTDGKDGVASLDRFDATDRLCADPRFWSYIDGCVPSKNALASNFKMDAEKEDISCPVPPLLNNSTRARNDAFDGLEIAPFVYLYFEPWPLKELPIRKTAEESSSGRLETAKVEDIAKATSSGKSEDGWYSVVLCVAKHVFVSVEAVNGRLLSFILNDWLKSVPLRGPEPHESLRERMLCKVAQLSTYHAYPSFKGASRETPEKLILL